MVGTHAIVEAAEAIRRKPASRGFGTLRAMRLAHRLSEVGVAPDDARWSVIAERRPAAADAAVGIPAWYLVVTSTGIVCRPGCPARTPRRDRVRIVETLGQALVAGARPCLRCHPERVSAGARHTAGTTAETTAVTLDAAAAARMVLSRLDAALAAGEEPPSDRELAVGAGMSERRLRDVVRQVIGVTPRAWLAARRAERLRVGLAGGAPVLDALLDAGYGASSAAYDAAAGELGMPPGRFRRGGLGERVRWTSIPIPGGVALVAATDRGLCAVRLGDDTATLEAGLRHELPAAELVRDDGGLAWMAAMVADLAGGRPRPDAVTLPLDVLGTAFRRRVWEALRRIPAGETRTYGELAAEVGVPAAARAVGAACAANPVALVVPCHRAVGSDGRLHGYRWGLERKRRLLDTERSATGTPGEAPTRASA